MAVQKQPSNKGGAWIWGVLAVGIVLTIILSSSGNRPTAQPPASNSDLNADSAADVQTPATVQLPAVDTSAIMRATRHLKLALDAEGFSGAMIYSQNCFASLDGRFSWSKLDQCEAFDSLAQVAMSESEDAGSEATYFDKDAVESRFTTSASQHQAEANSMRAHLANLVQGALARIADLQGDENATQVSNSDTEGNYDESASGSALPSNDDVIDSESGDEQQTNASYSE